MMINPHIPPSIHPELKAHTLLFKKKVYKIGENVYSAVGWAPANTIMIEGEDGIVLVDVGREIESATEVKKKFSKVTQKPVKAIILTHFHPDHIHGMKAWISEDDVKSGRIDIYAHERLLDGLAGQSVQLGPVLSMRTRYTFGAFLSAEDRKDMNIALGPLTKVGTFTFIAPTVTMKDTLDITVSGIRMRLIHVPSEAPDEIIVYLPDSRILLSAEVIQGPTFPNIYPLRGSKFRDPVLWFKSIDVMRALKAEHMVPGHGQPVFGESNVEEVLRMYRDGIQYLHDQTLRYMNRGLTPDELAHKVAFPPHLENYKPYLRQYYGTVKHCVRDIYHGYLGWFQGDPVALDPVPQNERSKRLVELMGGRDTVLREAQKAHEDGDFQWAAELATYLIRTDRDDMESRNIKAAAFRNLGYAQMNINWRNWYLTSAMELDGSLNMESAHKLPGQKFASPDVVKALPAGVTIEALTIRLIAEETYDVHLTMGFQIADMNEEYAMEIRKGVAQFHDRLPEEVDVMLSMNRRFLNENLLHVSDVRKGVESGDITIRGKWADVERFFACFELEPFPIWLTVR
jgi:alkyl sulfatase BDS1-like metallo-beta-lactamase superfamily hydrolase